MRKLNLTIASVAAIAALAACSNLVGGNLASTTTTTVAISAANPTATNLTSVPKSLTVAVPSSLVKSSLTAKGLVASRAGSSTAPSSATFFKDEGRGAYHWVKETMWQTQKRIARAAVKMVLLDSIMTTNKLVATATAQNQAATTGHVWTAAEISTIQALIPAAFLGNADFTADAKIPKAGDTINLPSFTYNTVPNTDAVNAAYNIVVTFASQQSEDDNVATTTETNSFYWTTDKSQFKVAYQKIDNSTATPTILEMNFVAYDSTTSTLVAGRQGSEGSMNLQVAKDATSTTGGVVIAFSSSITGGNADEYKGDLANATLAITATGYADASGGSIKETFVLTLGTGTTATTTTFYFKEAFNGLGKLILAQVTDSTFTTPITLTIPGVTNDETVADKYKSEDSTVEAEHQAMDQSQVSQDIQKEEQHHAGDMPGHGVELEFAVPAAQSLPAVGDTWSVSSTKAFATADILGTGLVASVDTASLKVKLTVTFAKRPALTGGKIYVAPVDSAGAPIAASAITITFER